MSSVFVSLALVLGLSAAFGVLAKALKQPVILGYVFAGIILGSSEMMEVMGRLGVTFLLFIAGMELSLTELKKMGKTSILTAFLQIFVVSGLGMILSTVLGFSRMESIYLGLGLAFGSTIMVVKILSERGDLQSLQGKISVGYLLVQDFVAIGLLVVLSGGNPGSTDFWSLGWLVLKGVLMVGVALVLAEKVMSTVVDYIAGSTELLFLTSIGWCLLIAVFVASPMIGFSLEIGGFLAGLTLANISEQTQIISRIRPLRDFFLTLFFVTLGASVSIGKLTEVSGISLTLSLIVILITPLVVTLALRLQKYHKRTSFLAGISVSQISEFSLILASGGVRSGVIGDKVLTILTFVALITMTSSSYMILYGQKLYIFFGKYLNFGNDKANPKTQTEDKLSGHVVLFGHNRTGSRLRPVLKRLGFKVIVVDFNPEIVEKLKSEGQNVLYGDMSDFDLYEALDFPSARMIISTVPDLFDNLNLLNGLKKYSSKGKRTVILTANDDKEANILYKTGVDYVLVPNQVGGDFLAGLIEKMLMR